MSTSLTTRTTLGLIPLAIGIFMRHYYDKVLKDKNKSMNGEGAATPMPLRLEELIHTVEELQQFTRMHTPAGPSSHVVRLAIPQSCCAEAVRALVHAFGGVRWWQVRPGDGGIDAEWIMDKSDWKEEMRREKAQTQPLGAKMNVQDVFSHVGKTWVFLNTESTAIFIEASAGGPHQLGFQTAELGVMRTLARTGGRILGR